VTDGNVQVSVLSACYLKQPLDVIDL